MSNRVFTQFHLSLVKQPVALWGKVAIGASGAPTLDASLSKGIASIVRNSAGLYTVTLQDGYQKFLGFVPTIELAAGSPGVFACVVRAHSVTSAKTIQFGFLDATGAAADIASGATLRFKVELDRSSV